MRLVLTSVQPLPCDPMHIKPLSYAISFEFLSESSYREGDAIIVPILQIKKLRFKGTIMEQYLSSYFYVTACCRELEFTYGHSSRSSEQKLLTSFMKNYIVSKQVTCRNEVK